MLKRYLIDLSIKCNLPVIKIYSENIKHSCIRQTLFNNSSFHLQKKYIHLIDTDLISIPHGSIELK